MAGHVLLDTDVFSFLSRGDSRGQPFRRAIEGKRPCLSFASVAELCKRAWKRGWGPDRVREMEAELERYLIRDEQSEALRGDRASGLDRL